MPAITFREADGTAITVESRPGQSLMEAARSAGIDGIVAECGGSMVCGTCHVYLSEPVHAALPPASAMEADMLDWGVEVRPTSRLSCQVAVCDLPDGAVVDVPARQR